MASIFYRIFRCNPIYLISNLRNFSISSVRNYKYGSSLNTQIKSATDYQRLNPCVLHVDSRNATIFTHYPQKMIWEGVTGPGGSTKKRARGKRRVKRTKTDLHMGQRVGSNREGILWPVLNSPLYSNNVTNRVEKGDLDERYIKRLEELRNKSAIKKKRSKLPPLLRGWTSRTLGGQSLGPLESGSPGFDTRVLEIKVVATMTATVGRYRRFSALVVAGNGQGVCGIGRGKSVAMRTALRRAKSRAFHNLVAFDIKDNRTLWHLAHVRQWHTTIFASPKPEGHGLICHRVLKALCQIIGIKDMYAKVEGNTKNYLSLARGFLRLLNEQETYSEIANRFGLHVVELDGNQNMYPRVLASPSSGVTHIKAARQQSLLKTAPCSKPPKYSNSESDLRALYSFWKRDPHSPPIIDITNPNRIRPPHTKKDLEFDPVDYLADGRDEETEESVQALLARGERDLDTLVTLKGLVLNIKRSPPPFYLNTPGVLKKKLERHRYRNQANCRLQNSVYEALDAMHIK